MSCDTLAEAPAAPDAPEHAESPHLVPFAFVPRARGSERTR
ncbi:hypothetical protein [Streptomyces sp. NPDC005374]